MGSVSEPQGCGCDVVVCLEFVTNSDSLLTLVKPFKPLNCSPFVCQHTAPSGLWEEPQSMEELGTPVRDLSKCVGVGERLVRGLRIEHIHLKVQKTQRPSFQLRIQITSRWRRAGSVRREAAGIARRWRRMFLERESGWQIQKCSQQVNKCTSQHAFPAEPLLWFRKRWHYFKSIPLLLPLPWLVAGRQVKMCLPSWPNVVLPAPQSQCYFYSRMLIESLS